MGSAMSRKQFPVGPGVKMLPSFVHSRRNFLARWGRVPLAAFILTALLAGLLLAPMVYAVPASPVPRVVSLPDGTTTKVYLRGDEFVHWNEDENGYALLQDADKREWLYAEYVGEGVFKATKHVLGNVDPVEVGIERPNRAELRAFALQQSADRAAAAAAAGPQRAPLTGTMRNLVILVNFSDLTVAADVPDAVNAFDALFNDVGYTTDGAMGSVKDYYHEVSYNQLTVQSTIAGPVTLSNGYAYYGEDFFGIPGWDMDPQAMVSEALAALDASGFNFATMDGDGDGWVDGLTIIHAGGGQEYSGNNSDYIWSHKWNLPSVVTYDGVQMFEYHTEPARRGSDAFPSTQGITRIGVICHENGHFLGLPDLYDTDYSSVGVGEFCLMSGGSWNGSDGGESPAHMSAWCKATLGWVTPTVINATGTYTASQVETNQNIYKLQGAFSANEYFLLENRQGAGFDAYLPGSQRGILIWHVDESRADNDDETHFLVDLEEAGGTQDFELSPYGTGDDDDYFRGGYRTSFSAATTPDNYGYAGTALGLEVTGIGATGASMQFTVTAAASYTLTVQSSPTSSLSITGSYPGVTPYATSAFEGVPITLTAPARAGSLDFIQWRSDGGEPLSASRTCIFTVSADTTIVAEYGERYTTNVAWGWGHNAWGQIGDDSTTKRFAPVQVAELINPAKIAGGQYHSLALDGNGFVYSWGDNSKGQLGYSAESQQIPVAVPGMAHVIDIAAGARHSLAVVDADGDGQGTVYAWGLNTSGQLGDGTTASEVGVVVQVIDPADPSGFLQGVTAVAAGEYHSVALKADGTVVAWGANAWGQLGDNRDTNLGEHVIGTMTFPTDSYFYAPRPVTVETISGAPLAAIEEISCGSAHTLARDGDGNVWSWGGGSWGQLGHDSSSDVWFAMQVTTVANAAQVSAGCWHSIVRTNADTARAWGANWWGQLGDGTYVDRDRPITVLGLPVGLTRLAAGESHSLALVNTGAILSWGRNRHGQLGRGIADNSIVPTTVMDLDNATGIGDSGAWHSFAMAEPVFVPPETSRLAGRLNSTGLNDYGQLGLGDEANRDVFTPQPDMSNVVQMDCGNKHAVLLDRSGYVWTVGNNSWGQLGQGDTNPRDTLTRVSNLSNIVAVDAGSWHTVALDDEGHLWVCGRNASGALGLGNSGDGTERSSFTAVTGVDRVMAVSAGGYHTLALRDDGTFWTVGRNTNGQLGLDDIADRSTFTQVEGLTGISALSAGVESSMLLLNDETVVACGANDAGQLGVGDNDERHSFTAVPGLSGITAISAGHEHALALDGDGNVWATGDGSQGQTGLATRNLFAQVPGISDVSTIFASGGYHSLAIDDDENLWVTGQNDYGQLGLGDTTDRASFTQVADVVNSIGLAAGEEFSLIQARRPTKWTFMVYMDGDNNLEEDAIDDFLEMAQVGSDSDVSIVAMLDRIVSYDNRYGDWTNTRRGLIERGDTPTAEWGESVGEANMGNGATLTDFMTWTMETYPAQNYAIILWNHGDGWYDAVAEYLGLSAEVARRDMLAAEARGPAANTSVLGLREFISRAVCFDESDGYDALSLAELQGSLGTIESAGGRMSLLGFDACLMGMVEVAYELREHGDVMVASECSEPAAGWPYHLFLADLAADPDMTGAELGTAIVDRYYEYYAGYTASAIDLSRMDALGAAVNTLAEALRLTWDTEKLSSREAAQAVMDELDLAVIRNRAGEVQYPGAHGLAVYLPWGTYALDADYHAGTLEFAADTDWEEFMATFFGGSRLGWVGKARYLAQEFADVHHVDLYDFCERLLTAEDPDTMYVETSLDQTFAGGGTAQEIGPGDSFLLPYALAFDFPFYGQTRTQVWISENGMIDFADNGAATSRNTIRELIETERIAVMWTDLYINDVYITEGTDEVTIRWEGWLWPDGFLTVAPVSVNIEAVLNSDGTIQFNYGENPDPIVSWLGEPPTIGISSGDGTNYNLSVFDQAIDRNEVASILWTPFERPAGGLYSTGLNEDGQLGLGDETDRDEFTAQPDVTSVVQVDCGDRHAVLLDSDGNVWTVGNNDWGQLGQGDTTARNTFTQVGDLSNIVAVDAGSWHTVALDADGHVWVCGRNTWPALGLGDAGGGTERTSFVQVSDLNNITAVSAGGGHTFALRDGGTLWAVGRNDHGQLGIGDTSEPTVFTQVEGLSGVRAIYAGVYSSLVLLNDDTVRACGYNENGQLGVGDYADKVVFTAVPGLAGIAAVSVGYRHSLALDGDGNVWATGDGSQGQTGLATRNLFAQVPGISDVSALFASGGNHSLALDGDGNLWVTGRNNYGQLGLGDTTGRTSFEQVADVANCVGIAAGEDFSLILLEEEGGGGGVSARPPVVSDELVLEDEPVVGDEEDDQVLLTPPESGVDDLGVVEPTWPDDDERKVSETVVVQTVPVAAGASDDALSSSTDGVVDNRDNTQAKMFRVISGDWRSSRLVEGFYGRDYQYVRARDDAETARAQFVCRSLPAGTYDVYAWWSSRKDRGTSVAYEIHHADGVAEVRVDQTGRGGAWNKLGTYRFAAGAHLVEVHNGSSGENGFVCADAVNFVPRRIETTSNSVSPVSPVKTVDVARSAPSASNTTIPGASSSLTLTTLVKPGLLVTPGSRVPVAWTSVNLARYTPVSVGLYRGGEKVETLMAATPNDGEFVWAVNPDLRGDGYTLRIGVVGAENTLFGETEPFVVGLACEW